MVIEKNKFKIDIFDDQYSIISDEKESDILKASGLVDALMREIADTSTLGDRKKIAVLSALRIASRLVSLENSLQKLTDSIKKKGLSSSI